jgi:hypothetical protein
VTTNAAPGPLEVVVLTEEEVIVANGPASVRWIVPYNDGSLRAQRHPTAKAEQLPRGSGIVWRTRITLELPRGAIILRVREQPQKRGRSALDYLTSGAEGGAHDVTRTRFRVGAGGELIEEPRPR